MNGLSGPNSIMVVYMDPLGTVLMGSYGLGLRIKGLGFRVAGLGLGLAV